MIADVLGFALYLALVYALMFSEMGRLTNDC